VSGSPGVVGSWWVGRDFAGQCAWVRLERRWWSRLAVVAWLVVGSWGMLVLAPHYSAVVVCCFAGARSCLGTRGCCRRRGERSLKRCGVYGDGR
jgi:hypothetical protein